MSATAGATPAGDGGEDREDTEGVGTTHEQDRILGGAREDVGRRTPSQSRRIAEQVQVSEPEKETRTQPTH